MLLVFLQSSGPIFLAWSSYRPVDFLGLEDMRVNVVASY